MGLILEIPAPKNSGVVGNGNNEYASTTAWPFHLFSFILLPRNCISSFFDLFKYLVANDGAYKSKIYLPKTEQATPITTTAHTFNPKRIWKNIIIVNAGGNGNGTISNNKAPRKTNTYCHHILLKY